MKKILFWQGFSLLCDIWLLVVVWHHAYWVVAFLLTMMQLRFRMQDLILQVKALEGEL